MVDWKPTQSVRSEVLERALGGMDVHINDLEVAELLFLRIVVQVVREAVHAHFLGLLIVALEVVANEARDVRRLADKLRPNDRNAVLLGHLVLSLRHATRFSSEI